MVKYKCQRTEPIGENPRRFYGFRNKQTLTKHINKYFPGFRGCIGKIKELKTKREFKEGLRSDYLVYFKIRKK